MNGKTQAVRQPSIEELLASIKQAIHERVTPAAPGRAPAEVATAGQDSFAGLLGGDVRLEEALARLNQAGWRRDGDASSAVDHGKDAAAGVAAPPPAPRPAASPPARLGAPERPARLSAPTIPGTLLSSEAARAANSAFGRLAEAVAHRSPEDERRLDGMTREILRPLLKAWLDANLPGLVERLVREEIERVARPGR